MSVAYAAAERLRMREQINRVRAMLDALESSIEARLPCSETAQAISTGTTLLVTAAGRHDAYQRIEEGR